MRTSVAIDTVWTVATISGLEIVGSSGREHLKRSHGVAELSWTASATTPAERGLWQCGRPFRQTSVFRRTRRRSYMEHASGGGYSFSVFSSISRYSGETSLKPVSCQNIVNVRPIAVWWQLSKPSRTFLTCASVMRALTADHDGGWKQFGLRQDLELLSRESGLVGPRRRVPTRYRRERHRNHRHDLEHGSFWSECRSLCELRRAAIAGYDLFLLAEPLEEHLAVGLRSFRDRDACALEFFGALDLGFALTTRHAWTLPQLGFVMTMRQQIRDVLDPGVFEAVEDREIELAVLHFVGENGVVRRRC